MSFKEKYGWKKTQTRLCHGCFYYDSRTRKCALNPDIDPLEPKKDEEEFQSFMSMCSKRKPWYGCSNCRYGLGRACVSTCLKQTIINWKGTPKTTDKEVSACA